MTTVPVSDVPRGHAYETLEVDASVASLLAKRVEASACPTKRLVSCDTQHALVKAAHDAFYDHHPLVLRPDDVWFCIAQGFATHVNEHVELLRERFVTHEGKKKLIVDRPDFVLGQANPWPEAFEGFANQVGEHVGELKDLVSARFSTTTPTEAAAFDVCVMDGFQGYFDYEMRVGCGIPEITVHGSAQDWASMIPRVRHLSEYGLEAWTTALIPVLEAIQRTAAGEVDKDFWRSFFRYESGSGPAELTGWILTLFPYIAVDYATDALGPNPYLSSWAERWHNAETREGWLRFGQTEGPSISAIPQSLASAPVQLVDIATGAEHALRFVAGMFGVEQDEETLALSPVFGWAIVYDEESTGPVSAAEPQTP